MHHMQCSGGVAYWLQLRSMNLVARVRVRVSANVFKVSVTAHMVGPPETSTSTELNRYYGPTPVLRPVGTIQHCWNILIVTTDF